MQYNTDSASHMPRMVQYNTYTMRHAHGIVYYTPIHGTIWCNTDPASHMPRIIQYNTYTVREAHRIVYYTPMHGTEIHHEYNHTMHNTKYTIYRTAPYAPYTIRNIVPRPKYAIQFHMIY